MRMFNLKSSTTCTRADKCYSITNSNDTVFTGNMYISNTQTELVALFDTTQAWTMAFDKNNMRGCGNTCYDSSAASINSFAFSSTDTKKKTLDAVTYSGKWATDNFCTLKNGDTNASSSCVTGAKLFMVQDMSSPVVPDYGAIVGLANGNPNEGEAVTDKLYIEKMQGGGKIANKEFAFYLDNTGGTSFIDIGAFESSRYDTALQWLPVVEQDYYWSTYLKEIQIGNYYQDAWTLEN